MSVRVAEAIAETIARHHTHPFTWGLYDCATLWGDVATAISGRYPFAGLPAWTSQRGALRTLRASGHASVEAFLAAHYGEILPAAARFGDLVLPAVDIGPLLSPAVVLSGEAFTRSLNGFMTVPAPLWRRAFRVTAA